MSKVLEKIKNKRNSVIDSESIEEYFQYLDSNGYIFLFEKKQIKKKNESRFYENEYVFCKFFRDEITFISFEETYWHYPYYQVLKIDDIIGYKMFSDAFRIDLPNDKSLYIGDQNSSKESCKEFFKGTVLFQHLLDEHKQNANNSLKILANRKNYSTISL